MAWDPDIRDHRLWLYMSRHSKCMNPGKGTYHLNSELKSNFCKIKFIQFTSFNQFLIKCFISKKIIFLGFRISFKSFLGIKSFS